MWSGDARDGVNGGGNYVRWIVDDDDQRSAAWFFGPRCDQIRVMPFLDGVPCSIHGYVLADGTAVFRPVEIVTLRDVARRQFVYAGLGTYWDPPARDREEMRETARRVGDHLAAAHGYRGAFGIDGVLSVDGFVPTELNTRMSGGAAVVGEVDRRFFTLLQARLVSGDDVGLTAADVESLVPVMDAERVGRVIAIGEGRSLGAALTYPVTYDGIRMERSDVETGNTFSAADTANGFFAKVDPCTALRPGRAARRHQPGARRADGPRARVRLRRARGRRRRTSLRRLGLPPMARVVVVGGGFGGMAAAARLAKLGHEVTLLERSPQLGGSLAPISEDGFTWDAAPASTLMPAVVRDLFRKSGRPLEAELGVELEPLDPIREHRFEDLTSVRVTGGSRAAQLVRLRRAGQGPRSAVGRLRRLVRRRLGGAAAPLLRGAVDARRAAPRGGRPARDPRDAAQAVATDLPRRPPGDRRRPPLRR